MRKAYQSELSDSECSCLESYLPAPEANGRPRLHSLREILHAIFFYVLKKSGCAWRLLAHDFLPWKTLSTITFPLVAFGWKLGKDAHRPTQKRVRVRLQRNPQSPALQ
jgi:transposase